MKALRPGRLKYLWCCLFLLPAVLWSQAGQRRSLPTEALGPCPGDVNVDGARDVLDVVLMTVHIKGTSKLTGDSLANADIDGNGFVEIPDVIRLRRQIAGLDPLPACAGTAPRITAISPGRGSAGSNVTILGVNFGATAAANTVKFQDQSAVVVSASATRLVAMVPSFYWVGAAEVTVTVAGQTSRAVTFVIDRFEPRIQIQPMTLLAGSAPAFSMRVEMDRSDLPIDSLILDFSNVSLNTASLAPNKSIGSGYVTGSVLGSLITYKSLVTLLSVQGGKAEILLKGADAEHSYVLARGSIQSGGSGVQLSFNFAKLSKIAMNQVQGTISGSLVQLLIYPGTLALPALGGQPLQANITMRSMAPTAGQSLTKTDSQSFTTVAATPDGPSIERVQPDEPSYRTEIGLFGRGFSALPSENRVTFAGPGGARLAATVVSAAADRLTAYLPIGAASGPVRVERGNRASNDYSIWLPYSPQTDLVWDQRAPRAASGFTLTWRESKGQLATQSLMLRLDKGTWNYATLAAGTKIGNYFGTLGVLAASMDLYVDETDSRSWARLIFKDRSGEIQTEAQAMLSSGEDGSQLLNLMITDSKLYTSSAVFVSDSTGRLTFSAPVFLLPAQGPLTVDGLLTSSPVEAGSRHTYRAATQQVQSIP